MPPNPNHDEDDFSLFWCACRQLFSVSESGVYNSDDDDDEDDGDDDDDAVDNNDDNSSADRSVWVKVSSLSAAGDSD